MKYNLDLNNIKIDTYKIFLKKQYLIPSRQILHENIDDNFKKFREFGFKSLFDLKQALSTNEKIDRLAKEIKISRDYLFILKRELGTLNIKKIAFNEFSVIEEETISNLLRNGIKNTKEFYEIYYDVNDDEKLADKIEISVEEIKRLLSLSKLVRINGIAAVAAVAFYEAGYKDYQYIINTTKETMLEKITKINDEKKYYKTKLGLKDMQFIIDYVKMISSFE